MNSKKGPKNSISKCRQDKTLDQNKTTYKYISYDFSRKDIKSKIDFSIKKRKPLSI